MTGTFHRLAVEFFQPGDEFERNGHALALLFLKKQQRLSIVCYTRLGRGLRVFGTTTLALALVSNHSSALRQSHHVQNERDFSVSHNGCTGECRNTFDLLA